MRPSPSCSPWLIRSGRYTSKPSIKNWFSSYDPPRTENAFESSFDDVTPSSVLTPRVASATGSGMSRTVRGSIWLTPAPRSAVSSTTASPISCSASTSTASNRTVAPLRTTTVSRTGANPTNETRTGYVPSGIRKA